MFSLSTNVLCMFLYHLTCVCRRSCTTEHSSSQPYIIRLIYKRSVLRPPSSFIPFTAFISSICPFIPISQLQSARTTYCIHFRFYYINIILFYHVSSFIPSTFWFCCKILLHCNYNRSSYVIRLEQVGLNTQGIWIILNEQDVRGWIKKFNFWQIDI